jgi:hypothetical protein
MGHFWDIWPLKLDINWTNRTWTPPDGKGDIRGTKGIKRTTAEGKVSATLKGIVEKIVALKPQRKEGQ